MKPYCTGLSANSFFLCLFFCLFVFGFFFFLFFFYCCVFFFFSLGTEIECTSPGSWDSEESTGCLGGQSWVRSRDRRRNTGSWQQPRGIGHSCGPAVTLCPLGSQRNLYILHVRDAAVLHIVERNWHIHVINVTAEHAHTGQVCTKYIICCADRW